MAAVVGYLVTAVAAVAACLAVTGGRRAARRHPGFAPEDVAARHVSILGALAGFAVTGIVFLVTQARNVPDPGGTAFTSVLIMFLVAYMGYFSSSVLFANVAAGDGGGDDEPDFDLAAAQYAGASVSLFSVFLGWFALKPLLQTFGLDAAAALSGWLLLGAVVVGYAILVNALHRSGYARGAVVVLPGIVAVLGAVAYAVIANVVAPQLRSADATLNLVLVAFALGVPATGLLAILPILARQERLAPILAARWHVVILAYAASSVVLSAFLLLSVNGLA